MHSNQSQTISLPISLYMCFIIIAGLSLISLSLEMSLISMLTLCIAVFGLLALKYYSLRTKATFAHDAQEQPVDTALHSIKAFIDKLPLGVILFDDLQQCYVANSSILASNLVLDGNNVQGKYLEELLQPNLYSVFRGMLDTNASGQVYEYLNASKLPCVAVVSVHQANSADTLSNANSFNVLMVNDITEVHESKNQLTTLNGELKKQTEIAVANSVAKSKFLASMSHQIRTQLNGLTGMIQLLKMTTLDDTQTRYTQTMYHSARALLKILNDILDLSKLESGEVSFESEVFDVELLLTQISDTYVHSAGQKGVELVNKVAPSVPKFLVGDAFRISQIISNFVSNSMRFTESGTIVIDIKLVEKDDKSAIIEFSVKDNGMGMTDSKKERVLASLEKADNSMTNHFSGFGLKINKDLVTKMNGQIGLESTHNVGSRFWFRLPLLLSPNPVHINEWKVDYQHILVLDDIEESRANICTYLESWGVKTTQASSAIEALDMFSKHTFDAVITDWKMPENDGMWFFQKLKELKLADHNITKMIMVTAYDKANIDKTAHEWKDIELLSKPVMASELFNCLHGLKQQVRSTITEVDDSTAYSPPALTGTRILIVDDNEINLVVASSMLEQSQVSIETANDGAQAIEKVKTNKYDLILMDYHMPVMDGIEATIQLRNLGYTLPIVAMTAAGYKEDVEAYYAAGMNGVVIKPFELKQLIEEVKLLLNIITPT